jgi:hypothetical protein
MMEIANVAVNLLEALSESALDKILEPGAIKPVYQPVFRVIGGDVRIEGVEALRGTAQRNFESADLLFGMSG